ncbi:MAG: transposase [Thermoleophilaceae bacterium]|nr:transposase [Thermoleophilaceae bacterium]
MSAAVLCLENSKHGGYERAYRFAYPTSSHRAKALPGYLRWYNRRRPHGSLGARPPVSRVSYVCGQYT